MKRCKKRCDTFVVFASLIALASGCAQKDDPADSADSNPAAIDGSQFLLSAEPKGAQDVIQVRESAKDKDEIVIVGRIGGKKIPWVKGRAAFYIVDSSLKACSDIPGDKCPFPWDYCCETDKLPKATALVKIVDKNGNLVKAGAKELLKLKELQTVVVRGKAVRIDGNLTVLANALYVKK